MFSPRIGRHLALSERPSIKISAIMAAIAMLLALAFVAIAKQPAYAGNSTPSDPTCTTEYQWELKGKEYRWKTVYKEAKQLKGWYVVLPNTWHQGDPHTWYDLPAEKQPPRSDQIAPTGTVPLSVYGGPGGVSTQYQYKTSYTEYFPSETGFSAGPPPAGKDWGNPVAERTVVLDTKWSATSPGAGWTKTGQSRQVNCFDWNWEYAAPTCSALTVVYPGNIPAGQANDVNVRIVNLGSGGGEVTLNFHNNSGTWSGTKSFVYADHPSWPGWSYYKVVWTQVAGTNYHWQGEVICGNPPQPDPVTASFVEQCLAQGDKQVLIDIVNPTDESVEATVKVDGVFHALLDVNANNSIQDYELIFDEDTGTHTFQVLVDNKVILEGTDIGTDCAEPETPTYTKPTITVTAECGADDWTVTTTGIDPSQDRFAFWLDLDSNGQVNLSNELLVERHFPASPFSLTDAMETWGLGTPTPGTTTFKLLWVNDGGEFDSSLNMPGTTLIDLDETVQVVVPEIEECPPTAKVCPAIEDGSTATNLDPQGWNSHDTRTTGVSEFVDGGYHLATTDTANPGSSQNKATLYRSVTPTPLADFGEPSVEYAPGGSGVKPGLQVGIDVDGDGDWDGYLVGEPWTYGDHNWWVNKPGFNVPSGMGYTSFGSWADFVAANPDAMVIEVGLSLGSGVVGDWTVLSYTYDCVRYFFDFAVEPPKEAVFTAPTVIDECGTENDEVVFGESANGTWKVGSVTDMGDGTTRHRVVFTPNDGFVVPTPGPDDEYIVVDGKAVWKLYTSNEDCPTPVEITTVPTVTDPTCTADGKLNIPTVEGVVFSGGKNGDGPGKYTITASAANGYVLTGDTGPWELTVKGKKTGGDCNTTPPGLANTGSTLALGGGILAAALLAAGLVLTIRRRQAA